jgi:predicted transcriptional regulator
MLVAGARRSEVAAELGVTVQAVSQWLQKPEFVGALSAARDESLAEAKGRIRGYALDAVEVLREVAKDGDVNPSARVAAAVAILDRCGMPKGAEVTLTGAGGLPVRIDVTGAVDDLRRLAYDDEPAS